MFLIVLYYLLGLDMSEKVGKVLNVYLGEDLKGWWLDYCASHKVAPSGVIREDLIKLREKQAVKNKQPATQLIEQPDIGKKERVEVRLTPSEYKAIEERVESGSVQRFIINSTRASLTNEPQFSMDAIEALWASSYELRAVGRNINQIAKRLNSLDSLAGNVSLDELAGLDKLINDHTHKAALLISASLDRWVVKNG
jgi:hypothetical protein